MPRWPKETTSVSRAGSPTRPHLVQHIVDGGTWGDNPDPGGEWFVLSDGQRLTFAEYVRFEAGQPGTADATPAVKPGPKSFDAEDDRIARTVLQERKAADNPS